MKPHNKATTQPSDDNKKYSTHQAAALLCHAPQSLRAALCRSGHFMGMVPTKLPNGRLLWGADKVHALLNGNRSKCSATCNSSELS